MKTFTNITKFVTISLLVASCAPEYPTSAQDQCNAVLSMSCDRDFDCSGNESAYTQCLTAVQDLCIANTRTKPEDDFTTCLDAWNDATTCSNINTIETTPTMAACFSFYAHDGAQ